VLLPARDFARRRGVPFVVYPLTHLGHGAAPGSTAESRYYALRHQTALVTSSDALVAQTPAEADFYAMRGMPRSRILVGGPGIEPETLSGGDAARFRAMIGRHAPLVLFAGHATRGKGATATIQAMQRVWRAGVAADLVLIGSHSADIDPYLATLSAAERERVHRLGWVDGQTRRDALAAATLLCLPSGMDSFGLVYLEAWRYRKPVIAAKTWGVTDLVRDGENGLVVPFDDPVALADALQRLLANPDLAQRLGEAGYRAMQAHTWAVKCEAVATLYERLTRREDA
jgi:glycosyltransferase involved in cell wall biosynthesis